MADVKKALEDALRRDIPLADAIGVRVVAISGSESRLAAPLAPNINHMRTAFGGSLHSLAVLACWSLVSGRLVGRAVSYLVIQDSRIEYLKLVDADFEARAVWAEEGAGEAFLRMLDRKGRARARLRAEILCRGEVRARLTGSFVASLPR